jgi:7-cyano-7-deazaguanine synthase in queuosine biosynthesis
MTSSKTKVKAGPSVDCHVFGAREDIEPQRIRFNSGRDLSFTITGDVGPRGISPQAADLMDLAAAVFQIERQLRGRGRTNPPQRFELTIRLRAPSVWEGIATEVTAEILNLLGNAQWNIHVEGGLRASVPNHTISKNKSIETTALFSGGLDSACGALTIRDRPNKTKLVSFYTGQKSLQTELAKEMGFAPPAQWRMNWSGSTGRGYSFFYRSFLFLALAGAVAESYGSRHILQFENGVLASAIPPAPSFAMTHHAHPRLQSLCARLFHLLFGGKWIVSNPFLSLTKQECVAQATQSAKGIDVLALMHRTQTCWYYRSNRVVGDRKRPNTSCGICIPCLVRQTALPGEKYMFDLRKDAVRNKPTRGRAFRSYYGFLSRVLSCDESDSLFFAALPAAGRALVSSHAVSLTDLHRLFHRFATEFMETYDLNPEEIA